MFKSQTSEALVSFSTRPEAREPTGADTANHIIRTYFVDCDPLRIVDTGKATSTSDITPISWSDALGGVAIAQLLGERAHQFATFPSPVYTILCRSDRFHVRLNI